MSDERIRTYETPVPVCPFCGHQNSDWWERDVSATLEDDGNTADERCLMCDEKYTVEVNRPVTFTTTRGWIP